MDINRAKEIIAVLAEGIDPTSGEVLPYDHVCNKGEIVRALYVALDAMEAKPKRKQPENAGKPWTKDDENLLINLYRSGASKQDLCTTFQRTATSIAARLVHLGIIENRDVFRKRKE